VFLAPQLQPLERILKIFREFPSVAGKFYKDERIMLMVSHLNQILTGKYIIGSRHSPVKSCDLPNATSHTGWIDAR
jgi:hypothetical protein